MNNTNKGFSTLATIGMVVLVLIIVGSFYYASNSTNLVDKESISLNENKENVVVNDEDNTIIDIDSEMTEDKISDLFYSGKVLAGNSSKLIDFNKSDYEKAIASDKVVILYFYASWCPICQAEFPKMQQAFDSLSTDKVVGFRVNYNDSDTDDYEKNLVINAVKKLEKILPSGKAVSISAFEERELINLINSLFCYAKNPGESWQYHPHSVRMART